MNTVITPELLQNTLDTITPPEGTTLHSGKVRESLTLPNGKRAIVTTDRISSFDYVFGTIPMKGQILNTLATKWFERIKDDIPTHYISIPHPNIMLVKEAKVLPVEIVVRGYLTGSTKTSAWYAYEHLNREICGITMPEGMQQHEPFPHPIITPTTKAPTGHDEPISREEVLSRGLATPELWEQVEDIALKLFAEGQKVAAARGLILVDTKYEMGLDGDGKLMVIDEIHTPDSSRYWKADTYDACMREGVHPESLDKEFFRRMLIDAGFDRDREYTNEEAQLLLRDDTRIKTAEKYLELYKTLTGETFKSPSTANIRAEVEAELQSIYLREKD